MQITVDLPDDLPTHQHAGREALEALALAGYRSGVLSPQQTRQLLGFETRYELEGFLKQHHVTEWAYDVRDFEQDMAGLDQQA